MSRKLIALIVILVLAVAIVLGLVLLPKKKEREVRILYPKIIASLPHWVAVRKEIYKHHRIIPKASPIGSSPDMIDAVRTGKCDFLPAVSLPDVVRACLGSDSPDFKILSHSRMRKDAAFDCLLATAGSRLASLKELEGRTIGVFPGGTSEACVKWYLRGLGLKVEKMKFQTVPANEQIDTLLAGRVDVVHAYEPQRTLGILQYKCRQMSPSIYAAIKEPASIGCTAISSRFVKEDDELARDVVAAWDEAIDFIRTHDSEAREILAQELGQTHEVAKACTWVDATKSTELDLTSLGSFIRLLQSLDPPQIGKGDPPKSMFYGK